jgi:hypothetical protein
VRTVPERALRTTRGSGVVRRPWGVAHPTTMITARSPTENSGSISRRLHSPHCSQQQKGRGTITKSHQKNQETGIATHAARLKLPSPHPSLTPDLPSVACVARAATKAAARMGGRPFGMRFAPTRRSEIRGTGLGFFLRVVNSSLHSSLHISWFGSQHLAHSALLLRPSRPDGPFKYFYDLAGRGGSPGLPFPARNGHRRSLPLVILVTCGLFVVTALVMNPV